MLKNTLYTDGILALSNGNHGILEPNVSNGKTTVPGRGVGVGTSVGVEVGSSVGVGGTGEAVGEGVIDGEIGVSVIGGAFEVVLEVHPLFNINSRIIK